MMDVDIEKIVGLEDIEATLTFGAVELPLEPWTIIFPDGSEYVADVAITFKPPDPDPPILGDKVNVTIMLTGEGVEPPG